MSFDDPGIFVSFDLYSAKPDPYWKLAPEQVDELRTKLQDLPEGKMVIPTNNIYHGFRVYNKNNLPQIPLRFEVFQKTICYREEHKLLYFKDVHNLEEWLFNLAIKQGHGELVNWIKEHDKKEEN